ncbi:MAG: polyphenol oxidase family protein [Candidatus Omnitrophica bacterium]|nr:polyphenol oxidase family protein [Candidatus Omnitrophota bacterium]
METKDPFIVYPLGACTFALYSRQRQDFSLKAAPDSSFPEAYKRLCDFLKNKDIFDVAESGLFFPEQVHGSALARADLSDSAQNGKKLLRILPGVDGLITDSPGMALAMLSADCLPLSIYDPVHNAIGIAHAGWRGTHLGIASALLDLMRKDFGSEPNSIKALLGPAIRKCCYKVDKQRAEFFDGHVVLSESGYLLDIVGANIAQLKDKGVRADNIHDSGVCTCCDAADSFSFRREGEGCGRMVSLVISGKGVSR